MTRLLVPLLTPVIVPLVLMLSAAGKPVAVREAIRAGALGYVLKNEETAQVRAAIKTVAGGKDWSHPGWPASSLVTKPGPAGF